MLAAVAKETPASRGRAGKPLVTSRLVSAESIVRVSSAGPVLPGVREGGQRRAQGFEFQVRSRPGQWTGSFYGCRRGTPTHRTSQPHHSLASGRHPSGSAGWCFLG